MQSPRLFFTPSTSKWLLIFLLAVFCIYCFSKPLVLSIDSVYGFLAYKGSLFFHSFNVIQDISTARIGNLDSVFVSWWSPGQWAYPALLNYFFGLKLGMAAICVTILSLIAGFTGYYRVFVLFRFSRLVSMMSLLVIFSGSTLYYCFIVYQGGEILEFAIFPWFVLYVYSISEFSWLNLLAVWVLILLCFIAKTTLMIYCPLVILARVISMNEIPWTGRFRVKKKALRLFFPLLVSGLIVYIFYLSRGPRPALINHFEISAEKILVPLTAPLSGVASIQQWIDRLVRGSTEPPHTGAWPAALDIILYGIVFFILILMIRMIISEKKIGRGYQSLLFILYGGLCLFFIFAYSFNANIDLNVRHFKLMSFLFVPAFISVLYSHIKSWFVQIVVLLICLSAVTDIFYLRSKWTNGKYAGTNYFYRNCSPLGIADKLDERSYNKLLQLDRLISEKNEYSIVFAESTADIAMDLKNATIFMAPEEGVDVKVYHQNGPMLLVAVSRTTLSKNPGFLKNKFPDYNDFDIAAKTDRYLFFISRDEHKNQ
jgi:hypothetical protein